jgi:predicted O-methyltransferase YrrM
MPLERFELMHRLVDSPPLDFLSKWSKLYDLTVAFGPDLVLELGRGWGNSTCVLTEAANTVGCRVVSIGFDSQHAWETRTALRLERVLEAIWFAPLTVVQDDITHVDFRPLLDGSTRALVFWDAHGIDIAEAIFDRLFPALTPDSRIVVDDI